MSFDHDKNTIFHFTIKLKYLYEIKPSKLSKTLYLIFPEFNKIEQGLSEEEVNKKILEI